jgi:hypothetical protein
MLMTGKVQDLLAQVIEMWMFCYRQPEKSRVRRQVGKAHDAHCCNIERVGD